MLPSKVSVDGSDRTAQSISVLTNSIQALAQQLMPHLQPQHKVDNLQPQNSASPHDHIIDPAIAAGGMRSTSAGESRMMSTSAGESGGDENGAASDSRKGGKRELSSSKRAAQNRAAQVSALRGVVFALSSPEDSSCACNLKGSLREDANISQRAFRQRKEGHIKQLEAQVKDYSSLSESYKAVQAENYQLRDYIISLQSRLIESQGDFPQPPSNIDLPRPTGHGHQHMQAPTAPMGSSAVSQLQASAAQAVADLGPDQQLDGTAYRGSSQATQRNRVVDNNDSSGRATVA